MKTPHQDLTAAVSERGQVAIPKRLRERFGIRPGQRVRFAEENGRLIVSKVATDDPLELVYGVLKARKRTDALMADIRGVDKP